MCDEDNGDQLPAVPAKESEEASDSQAKLEEVAQKLALAVGAKDTKTSREALKQMTGESLDSLQKFLTGVEAESDTRAWHVELGTWWYLLLMFSAAAIVSLTIVGNFAGDTDNRCSHLILVFWSLVPPIWFFGEYWYNTRENESPKSEKIERLKDMQTRAGAVWAGLLSVLIVLFKWGGS